MASVTGIIYVKCSTVSGGVTHCLRASVQWSGRAEIKLMTDWSQTAGCHFVSFSAGSRPFGKHPNSNFQTVLGLKLTLLIYCPHLSMIEYMSATVSHCLLYMTPLKSHKKIKSNLRSWKVLDSSKWEPCLLISFQNWIIKWSCSLKS